MSEVVARQASASEHRPAELRPLIREALGDDLNLILSTWLKSYRYASQSGRACSDVVFFPFHQSLIKNILQRSTVLCAADPDAPEVVWGWACVEGPCLHYVYVKASGWRARGVARALLAGRKIETYSHRTDDAAAYVRAHPQARVVYNPYLVWR